MKSTTIRGAVSALVLCAAMCASGCHLRPNFGPPGTIGVQREQALLHDPFPSTDLGPPISGARPRGYERPFAATRQLQGPFSRTNRGGQYVPQNGF